MKAFGPYILESEFSKPDISKEEAKKIGNDLGVDWDETNLEELRKGIAVELEHGSSFNKQTAADTDLIGNDKKKAAQVALAHLEELPDYYTRLEKMEESRIYESAPVDTIAVIGRFQPFTTGHFKLYQSAKKQYKNVLIGMATRKTYKQDEKNPFTDNERESIIKKAIPGVRVIRVPSIYYEDVWEAAGKEVAIGIGSDRISALTRMGGAQDGSGDFEFYVLPRPAGAVSATKVRQALYDGDERAFQKMTPRGIHKEYEWMRKRILEVTK
jgi:cytidyltransferase-like protein